MQSSIGKQRSADGTPDEGSRNIHGSVRNDRLLDRVPDPQVGEPVPQAIERQVHHRCGVKGKQLAKQQAAYDGDTQRIAQFRSRARSQSQRQAAQ